MGKEPEAQVLQLEIELQGHKLQFLVDSGSTHFLVVAFGLSEAPGTFQGAMNTTLAPINRKNTLVFFEDILIFSKTYQEHLKHVREVLALLRAV